MREDTSMGTTPAPGVDPAYDEYAENETGEVPHKLAPVDVRVIEAPDVEQQRPRTIVTDQVPIGNGIPTRIVPAIRTRHRLTIRADGGDMVIGREGVTLGTGFKLLSTTTHTIESTDELWAIASVATVTAHVISELYEG